MKKLLTALCVAACGFGAAAQAQQVVQARGAERMEIKDIRHKMEVPASDMQLLQQAKAPAPYDTLRWHDEYLSEECQGYYSLSAFGIQSLFGEEVALSPLGASMSGTGEVGATFQTENNIYDSYAGLDLHTFWVVGAYGWAYRIGSTSGWARVGVDGFDPEHMNEVGGVQVPDLPYVIKGYPHVERQDAYASYFDILSDRGEDIITLEMPLSMTEAVETPKGYIRYRESRLLDDQRPWPYINQVGGLFDEPFPAWANFGLSIDVELSGNKTYDSLWNWSLTAKTNDNCAFIDEWACWQRLDFSDHENNWVWLWTNDDQDVDCSLPLDGDEDGNWGLAPANCPQHDNGKGLFVYAFSLNMILGDGDHMMPMLYPIIQDKVSIEQDKNAYAMTVSVYPLPATDKVTIVALDAMQKVEIYNMAGSLVRNAVVNDNVLEVDVTSLTPGTYIAKIMTEKGVASKKLVVK